MKFPFIFNSERLSQDPANNYLQWLLRLSVSERSTDIFFCMGRNNLEVYRNHPKISSIEVSIQQLPKNITDFLTTISKGVEFRDVPEGFSLEVPMPLKMRAGLEVDFRRIYHLENIDDLDKYSPLRQLNVDNIPLITGLSKIAPLVEGYRLHLSYR
jgi:hypothetical protein